MVSARNLWLRMCANEYRALPPAPAHSQAQMPACIGPSWRKPERRVCRWLFYAICSIARTKKVFSVHSQLCSISVLPRAYHDDPPPRLMENSPQSAHHHRGSRGTGERGGRGPCRKIATAGRRRPAAGERWQCRAGRSHSCVVLRGVVCERQGLCGAGGGAMRVAEGPDSH